MNLASEEDDAGAIPQMEPNSQNFPKDPYKQESSDDAKRKKIKQLQKNRFQASVAPEAYITQGMQNMNLADTSGDTSPSRATVPQDMRHYQNPTLNYQENSSSDYSRVNVSNKNYDFSTSKPSDELNQEHVKRGMLEQYSTNWLEVPPCPAIPYTSIDAGQSSPKFIRPTMYRVPSNYALHKSAKVPFGLIIQPMADVSENESYIAKAEWGPEGPLRWNVWGGYVNPGTMIIESGTKARCNFCGSIFPIKDTKYSFMSNRSSIPELYYGSYEFDVDGKYVYYEARYPIYLFIIDVSNDAFQNGLFLQVLELLKNSLDSIPNPENTQIWILTVDEYVHWYNFPNNIEHGPKIHIACDAEDPFLPIPTSELMLNLENDRQKIDILLERLSEIHTAEETKSKELKLNLSSAISMAADILGCTGGRVLAFTSRLDNAGPGANSVAENHKQYNTDSEKSLFTWSSSFYHEMAQAFLDSHITLDLFWCTFYPLNLVNPTEIWIRTGGDVYYYKQFNDKNDGEKLHYDVFRVLTRNNAYDVAFRVRWSEGYSVVSYLGNFIKMSSIDFELPSIDADKTIGVVLRSEGSIK